MDPSTARCPPLRSTHNSVAVKRGSAPLPPRHVPGGSGGEVGSGRGAGLSASPFPRAASRTRRAPRRRSGLSTSPVTGVRGVGLIPWWARARGCR